MLNWKLAKWSLVLEKTSKPILLLNSLKGAVSEHTINKSRFLWTRKKNISKRCNIKKIDFSIKKSMNTDIEHHQFSKLTVKNNKYKISISGKNWSLILFFWIQRKVYILLAKYISIFYISRWLFETFGCQAYGVESYTAGYAALGFVIALCIERYCSVRYTEFCKYIYEYDL